MKRMIQIIIYTALETIHLEIKNGYILAKYERPKFTEGEVESLYSL